MFRSIRCYLGQQSDKPSKEDERYYREFCEKDPNCWTLDDRVYADFPTDLQAVAQMQQRKNEFQSDLAAVAITGKTRMVGALERMSRGGTAYGRSMMEISELADASKKLKR